MIYTLPLSLFEQLKAPESRRDPNGLLGKQDPRLRSVTGGSSRETSNTQKNANYRCRGEVSSLPHETKSSLQDKGCEAISWIPISEGNIAIPPCRKPAPSPTSPPPERGAMLLVWLRQPPPLQNLGPAQPPRCPRPSGTTKGARRRHCRLRPGGVSIGMAARGRRCLPGSGAVWALTRACGNNTRLPAHCLVRGK